MVSLVSNIQHTLSSVFKIRPEERAVVGLMFLHAVCIGCAAVFLGTAANSFFLIEFHATALPYMYIAVAIIAPLVGFLHTILEKHLSLRTLLAGNVACMAVMPGVFWGMFSIRLIWVIIPLFLWWELQTILLHVEFLGLSNQLFSIRQTKRFFGLISSGEQLATIVGGLAVPVIVRLVNTHALLVFAALANLGSLGLLLALLKKTASDRSNEQGTGQERAPLDDTPQTSHLTPFKEMLRNRYILLQFVIAICAVLGYYFIDNMFYYQARVQFITEERLASFLGNFFAVVSLVGFLTTFFATDRVISRYGIKLGVLFTPILIGLGLGAFALAGIAFPSPLAFFWLLTIIKLSDEVCAKAIDSPVNMTLYQPLPASQRLRVQTVISSVINPLTGGIAGILLLFLTTLFTLSGYQLALVAIVIYLAWLGFGFRLAREYQITLKHAISRHILDGATLSLSDTASLALLENTLQSPQPREVLYALNVLEEIEHPNLSAFLIELIAHPAAEIREDALCRIERRHITAALPLVQQRITAETAPRLQGIAIRTLARLGGSEVLEQIVPYFQSSEWEIEKGAMIGLLRSGGIQGIVLAGADLLAKSTSENPEERVFAATVLGEVGIKDFYSPLVTLLDDPHPAVRKAALISAGKLQNPKLWQGVVANLAIPELAATAVSVLIDGGEAVIPFLEKAFLQPNQGHKVKLRILRIYSHIRGDGVVAKLLEKLDVTNKTLFTHVLSGLRACRYHAPERDHGLIRAKLFRELNDAAWIIAALRDLRQELPPDLLQSALHAELNAITSRIFLLLSFLYDAETIMNAAHHLRFLSSAKHAYALETLDTLLDQELKPLVFALIEDPAHSRKLDHLLTLIPQEELDLRQRLEDILHRTEAWGNYWLKACALYTIGERSFCKAIPLVLPAFSHFNPLIRETAAWAIMQLDTDWFYASLPRIQQDPNPRVRHVIQQLQTRARFVLTIDKVKFLKTTALFANIPEDQLDSIAAYAQEAFFNPGETIYHEGDPGDCMYLIVEGNVRIENATRQFATLRKGEIFGEFSILDHQPRSVTVISETETCVLRFEQTAFHELLDEHSEVIRRVIAVICQRLRANIHRLGGWQHQLASPDAPEEQAVEESEELSPLEKMLILKTVRLFSYTPDETLEKLMVLLKEEYRQAGQLILKKGAQGEWMYIVIAGRVRIHDDHQTIGFLGNRATLGELSLLDHTPLDVAMTAETNMTLFRLDQTVFYEFMADHPDLAKGMVLALAQQNRELFKRQTPG